MKPSAQDAEYKHSVSSDPLTNLPTVVPAPVLLKGLVKARDTSLYHLTTWVATALLTYHLLSQVAVEDLSLAFLDALASLEEPFVIH